MDSHENSLSCHKSTAVWSKSTPNPMTIPCHLLWFYLFSMLEHDMDFGSSWLKFKSWNFHGVCYENDGISIGFRLICDATKLPSKGHEGIRVTFFTGEILKILPISLQFSLSWFFLRGNYDRSCSVRTRVTQRGGRSSGSLTKPRRKLRRALRNYLGTIRILPP